MKKLIIAYILLTLSITLFAYTKDNIFSYQQFNEVYTSKKISNNIIKVDLYKNVGIYNNFKIDVGVRIKF